MFFVFIIVQKNHFFFFNLNFPIKVINLCIMFCFVFFFFTFARLAYLSVLRVSSKQETAALMFAIITVLQLPPNESFSRRAV